MKKFYTLIANACVYTVLFTLFLSLVAVLAGMADRSISLPQFLFALLFGVIFSAAGEIGNITSLPGWARRLLHYAVTAAAFTFVAVISGKTGGKASTTVILLFVYTMVYAAGVGIRYLFGKISDKEKNGTER